MTRKKGFTLIELLAVIVVLAIIALIATPIVLNIIASAKKGSAEQSTTSYVKAIENAIVKDMLKQIEHEDKVGYQYDEISVDISGTKPTSGTYTLKDGKVETANFCVNGYNIEYTNGVSKANGKCEDTVDTSILAKAKSLVYENGTCKTDGTTYNYMGGCYIKGASTNNYVWYNGFMWRIMGINSDNTVRLITDEAVTAIPYGSGDDALTYATNEGYINDWLNDYFYDNLNSTKSIIKEGAYFCSETTNEVDFVGYDGNNLFVQNARTTCASGNEVTAKVGIISMDEVLLSDAYYNGYEGYISGAALSSLLTMTPYNASEIWFGSEPSGSPLHGEVVWLRTHAIYPIINVESTADVTKGVGTSSNYYVLVENKVENKTGTLGENVTSGEYVKLEGKTYRVVSKESDGIKLILDGYYEETEGTTYTMAYGNDNTFTLESGIGQKLNVDVLAWLGLSNSDKIVETTWYQGDVIDYGSKYTDALKETNGVQAKVGLIRVGEMELIRTARKTNNSIFNYWMMNKHTDSNYAWTGSVHGYVGFKSIDDNYVAIRPVIKVKTNLTISKGNGTWNNPYEV